MEVCTNYRYAMRHDGAFAAKRAQQKKEEEKAIAEPSIRETPRVPAKKESKTSKSATIKKTTEKSHQ